jgi:hypothetical protein
MNDADDLTSRTSLNCLGFERSDGQFATLSETATEHKKVDPGA